MTSRLACQENAMNIHRLYPTITPQHVLAECARELGQRRDFYPRRVAEARMTQDEADHQLAIARAWHQDAQRIAAHDYTPAALAPATHGISWAARREGIRRELDLRARVFPARVAEGRMTQTEADHRRDCLAALAARYDDGLDWIASNGAKPRFAMVHDIPEQVDQARREWHAHWQAVTASRQPQPEQKELI